MGKTYYDSTLTDAQIQQVLDAINNILTPSNNGKVLAISGGTLEARSVQWGGGYPEPTGTITITENGLHNVKDYAEANVQVQSGGSDIEVIPLTATANAVYTAPTGKAYSPVTVNVSGGFSKIELFPNGVSFYSQLNMTSISGGKNESDNWNILVNADPSSGYDNFVLKMANGDFSDKTIAVAFDFQLGENTRFLGGYDVGYRLSADPQTSFSSNFRNNLSRNKNLQHSADAIALPSSATDIYINFNLSALDSVATTISITNMRAYILN